MRTNWILFLGVILLMGCASDLTVQKRKYRPGWHIEKKGKPEEVHTASRKVSKSPSKVEAISQVSETVPEVQEMAHPMIENRVDVVPSTSKVMQHVGQATSNKIEEMNAPVKISGSVKRMKPQSTNRSNQLLAGIMCSGLLAGGLFSLKRRRFLKIAEWGRANRGRARTFLTGGHLALGFGAFYAGYYSGGNGMIASEGWFTGSLWTFMGAWALYPMRRAISGVLSGGFLRRKWHDLLLTVSGLLLIFSAATEIQSGKEPDHVISAAAISIFAPDQDVNEELVMSADEPEPRTPGQNLVRILLTVLATAVFLAMLSFLAGLSCNLSCSGQEGLAAVVLFGGLALAIFLFVIALRRIWSRKFDKPASTVN